MISQVHLITYGGMPVRRLLHGPLGPPCTRYVSGMYGRSV